MPLLLHCHQVTCELVNCLSCLSTGLSSATFTDRQTFHIFSRHTAAATRPRRRCCTYQTVCTQGQVTDAPLYSWGWRYPLHLTSSAMTYSSTDSILSSASATLHVPAFIRTCSVTSSSLNSASVLLPSCHATQACHQTQILDRCYSQPTCPWSANLSTRSMCLIIISPKICNWSSPWMLPTLHQHSIDSRAVPTPSDSGFWKTTCS